MSNIIIEVTKLNKGWQYVNYWWKVWVDDKLMDENGSMTKRSSIRRANRAAKKLVKQKEEEMVYTREFDV
jgi:hypothetical protein